MVFSPKFTVTLGISKALMEIECIKESVRNLPLTPLVIKTLRESTKLQSTHYSTAIEGNRFSQQEVKNVLIEQKKFKGKEKDEKEIKGYYLALEYIEKNVKDAVSEKFIKTIHALVEGEGRTRVKPGEYRDGQNVVRDSISGRIVYMPPEAKDVSILMKEFVEYLNKNNGEMPIPLLAGIAHYQFVTIHPYYDGNGRTARLLTNLILNQGGYDLHGIYSLEEYYAKNLQEYYGALSLGDHHNYYFGRVDANITPWLEYFIPGMLDAFKNIKKHFENNNVSQDKFKMLKSLTTRQRKVLSLFGEQDIITSKDVENLFNLSPRSARNLCAELVNEDILKVNNSSNKTRDYRIGIYKDLLNK
jgi:Fic family protein